MDPRSDGEETVDMVRERDRRARDVELLGAWRSGDVEAGERLFEGHAAAVARFFENKVAQGPEDLIQATFLREIMGLTASSIRTRLLRAREWLGRTDRGIPRLTFMRNPRQAEFGRPIQTSCRDG